MAKRRRNGNSQAGTSKAARLPEKDRLYVTEVAEVLARKDGLTLQGARMRIYRGIESGKIRSVRVLGTTMIPRQEAQRILEGEMA